MKQKGGAERVLDIDAVMQTTLRLDPAATREAVARYVQEIDEMSQILDTVDLPNTRESVMFSPTWPAPDATAGSE
jgi:hypothetical protein